MYKTELFKNSVFRYRSYNDNSINAFIDDRLYFSKPSYFNDPFDAVIYVNDDKLLASVFRDIDEGMVSYLNSKISDPSVWKQRLQILM